MLIILRKNPRLQFGISRRIVSHDTPQTRRLSPIYNVQNRIKDKATGKITGTLNTALIPGLVSTTTVSYPSDSS